MKDILAAYEKLSPKGRILFEMIGTGDDDWVSTKELCQRLGQGRLSGSDQRQLKRMMDSRLLYVAKTRAAMVDYPDDYLHRAALRRSLRQQQWVNLYALSELARPLAETISEQRREQERERQKAYRREEIRRYGRLKIWFEDLAFAWGVMLDELRGYYD